MITILAVMRANCFVRWKLLGKKIGIVGLGQTGYNTARIAIGFGMKVWAYTSKSRLQLPPEIRKAELDQLFHECDIISLHCPLNDSTRELINASLQRLPAYSFHPNDNRSTVVISREEFLRYLAAVGNTYEFIELY